MNANVSESVCASEFLQATRSFLISSSLAPRERASVGGLYVSSTAPISTKSRRQFKYSTPHLPTQGKRSQKTSHLALFRVLSRGHFQVQGPLVPGPPKSRKYGTSQLTSAH